MRKKLGYGTLGLICSVVAGVFTILGGVCSQREQIEKLEEIDREYHEGKNTETNEEEV